MTLVKHVITASIALVIGYAAAQHRPIRTAQAQHSGAALVYSKLTRGELSAYEGQLERLELILYSMLDNLSSKNYSNFEKDSVIFIGNFNQEKFELPTGTKIGNGTEPVDFSALRHEVWALNRALENTLKAHSTRCSEGALTS
jgi:hypothetical protein